MAGLFSLDDVKNNPHRSGFSLQSKRAFTAKAGELLPVFWSFAMLGDRFKLKNSWFTRTQPVQTSAYTRMKEYYDYFFVPLSQLWKQGPQSMMQLLDQPTAAISPVEGATIGTAFPSVSLSELWSALVDGGSDSYAESKNVFGYRRGDLAAKLLRYLGYGNFMTSAEEGKNYGTSVPPARYWQEYSVNSVVNLYPLFSYQKIYNDVFRNTVWENSAPYTFNVDYWTGEGTFGSHLKSHLSAYRQLPRTMFDMGYCNWNKDIFMGLRPNSQFGDVAVVNVSAGSVGAGSSTFRIDDSSLSGLLSYNGSQDLRVTGEPLDHGTEAPLYLEPVSGAAGDRYYLRANEAMDTTSPIFSPVGRMRASLNSVSGSLTGSFDGASAFAGEFSILALRQAEALQKWKEITLSGDQTYRDQVYKHFGVRLPKYASDQVRYLGGFDSQLDISEVVNQNITGESQASIAGKGVGIGRGGDIDFEADGFGIVMCIYHCLPLLDYDLSGQDPQLLITRSEDFAIPEFDNLGFQELPAVSLINTTHAVVGKKDLSGFLGYLPRYYPFKTSYDRVMGAFSTTLRDWVAPVDDSYLASALGTTSDHFVSLDYSFFKVDPSVLNSIFAMTCDGTWDTDQLLVNSEFDVKVVRSLSVDGLPY